MATVAPLGMSATACSGDATILFMAVLCSREWLRRTLTRVSREHTSHEWLRHGSANATMESPKPSLLCQPRLRGTRRPHRFVVAERHRGPRPTRRRLGEAQHRPEMAQPTDWRVARDRPALELFGGEFLRHVLELGLRNLAASDQPAPGLRQRDPHEPAAALTRAAS